MNFDFEEVEKLYPGAGGLMIDPQLIYKGTQSQLKATDNGEWFAELKKDGALYMFVKGSKGQTYLFGRTKSKATGLLTEKSANVPHIIEAFHDIPNNTILLGEIYYPGKTSKDVTTIMGCLPPKAIERQQSTYGPIHYYVYDCLEYNGVSLLPYDNWSRYEVTKAIFRKHIIPNFIIPFTVELAGAVEENIYQAIGEALAAGEEGMVVKKKTGMYEPGKRPQTMLKAKQVDYIDAIIIGFKDPIKEYTGKELENWGFNITEDGDRLQGPYSWLKEHGYNPIPVTKHYYYGWKNAIEIGAYDEKGNIHSIGTIASGLTDYLREQFSRSPELYLNKVAQIQCMMKDNKEKTLRHGFFIGFHDDKNPSECTMSSIFN